MRLQRGTVVAVVVAVALVAAVVWLTRPTSDGVPLDPRSTGPDGTAAMVRLLEELGASVTVDDGPARPVGNQVIVVLADRLDGPTRARVRERVEGGARLVLFDPASELNPVDVEGMLMTDVFGVLGEQPRCDVLDGVVDRVESARWTVLSPTPASTAECFPLEDGAGLVVHPVGEGEVVVTGAVDALVNRTIGEADHARLVAALVAPDGAADVTIVWDAALGGGDTALLDLVPTGLRRAFWVVLVAVALYALSRARRLGRPVGERLPVRVPASELALSIGDLLARHGHHGDAARRLREDLRTEVATALHVPQDTPPDVLVELLAERAGADLDRQGVAHALGDGAVPDDDALVAVSAALARVRAHVRAGATPGAGSSHR